MKKLNWGHGILIAIIVMVLSILALVYKVMNEKIELVTDDYYPKELKYEEEIQKKISTDELKDKIEIEISDSVKIFFPADFEHPELIKGEIWFYKASNMSDDKKDSIRLHESRTIAYSLKEISFGKYDVIIDWEYKGKSYYFKEQIFIDK